MMQVSAQEEPIPLSVLTGFLGSGKTTLLNRLLKSPQMENAAVIINEFGEIGLDHLLVETADENIMEMSSGCLCCTIRGDLINTLDDLVRRRDGGEVKAFDRVVIETTGLADPAPILHTIMNHPYLVVRYRLESVVATVDGVNGMASLDAHGEAVKQAAVADRIVLTKSDLMAPGEIDPLTARLGQLNPAARLLNAQSGEVEPDRLFDAGLYNPATKSADVARWLAAEAYEARGHHHHDHDEGHDVNRHDDHINSYCVASDEAIGINSFNLFMELLQSYHGPNLLRVKGIVKLTEQPDRPVVVHGVQHVFHPPVELDTWPDDDHRTRLVFITRDIAQSEIEALLKAFTQKISLDASVFQYDDTLSADPKGGMFD
jgi:G3E family GTPase